MANRGRLESRDLIGYRPVRKAIKELRGAVKGKHFSDLIDDQGNQYVDLVMEGGGMLGIALVGYVHALEEVGIRFLDLAGSSVGSITAMLLAAVDDKDAKKSEKLLDALTQQDLSQFLDGNLGARGLSKLLVSRRFGALRYPLLPFALFSIQQRLGVHPGERFEAWLKGILHGCGMDTTKKLMQRVEWLPKLERRDKTRLNLDDLKCRLALIAAEVTTRSKVEFPEMAELFWEKPEEVNPARFVRASMSVPFFFCPMRVELGPFVESREEAWKKMGMSVPVPGDDGKPHECLFIDGGIMSNFPINIFHQDCVPSAPTFGVRLSERTTTPVHTSKALASAVFDSARHTLDYDFIIKHMDYQHLVAQVDTTGYQWLDFNMKPEEMQTLFLRGVEAASRFLKSFNWDEDGKEKRSYKRVRATLVRQKSEQQRDGMAA